MGFRDRGVEIKTPEQIAKMRVAGRLVGETLELLRSEVRAGVSTGDLDAIAEKNIRDGGGVPSFLGYGHPPFPATICASVNDEVVHGIPGDRVLADGDVISIDCGAIVEGWHGDAADHGAPWARSRPDVLELMRVTEGSMWAGIAAARLGGRVTDISHAVEAHVRSQAHPTGGSYGILEDFTGHGIGTAMHQPPNVPNYGRAGRGPKLERGLALAVEPMVTLGSKHTDSPTDEWTVLTDDGSWAAHFEHTFTLTPEGAWVLTALDGGRGRAGRARRPVRRGLTARAAVPAALDPGRARRPPTTSTPRSCASPVSTRPSCRGSLLAETDAAARSTSTTGPGSCSAAGRGTPATPRTTKSAGAGRGGEGDRRAARRGGRARLPLPRRLLRHRHPRHRTRAARWTAAGRSRWGRSR